MLVKNTNLSISFSLTALRLVGFWPPDSLRGNKKLLYDCYGIFCFMFMLGTYIISQAVDMCLIWGDLPLMTGVAFVLFTNLAQAVKIFNTVRRRSYIQGVIRDADQVLRAVDSDEARAIVKSCDRETSLQQLIFCCLTFITMLGWATSAEKNQLPLRAWYPYDTASSPAYELTYVHQIGALYVAAFLNVGKDTLVTSLLAQCRCRLRLLGLSLRTLCQDLNITGVTDNPVRLLSMGTYLVNMMFQVFLYCYQGNQLSEESTEVAGAAYESPWYMMSTQLRRSILIIMLRCRRVAKITAGGFTTLSIASFMAIIKMSYSMFTLLQQIETKG